MTVKDEAQLIGRAIDSVRGFVDDVVVVDTGSSDATREIAAACGARVYERPWDGRFGTARNASLELARGEWALVLDGDEAIAPQDAGLIRDLIRDPEAVAYRLPVHNYTRSFDLLTDWHPNRGRYPEEETFSDCPGYSRFFVVRLFRRASGVRYDDAISSHINPVRSLDALGASIGDAPVVIHHFQFRKGGEAFIAEKQRLRLADEQRHLEQCPGDALAHLNVGRTLFALGDDARALWHLDRAVELTEEPSRALLSRAVVRLEIGDPDRAAEDVATALHRLPEYSDAWIVLGIAEHARGDYAAAEVALSTALRLRPWHPLALNSLGVLRLDRGETAAAADCFRQALRSLPDFPAARANLAEALAASGASDGADESLAVQIGEKRDGV